MSLRALEELKTLPHWVGWKIQAGKDGKPTKVPYVANNGKKASPTDPSTWVDFTTAAHTYKAAGHEGLGFVVASDDPYCGIDLDHCRDAETGAIEDWATAIVRRFDSYTEITPSRTGLRVWIRGRKSGTKCTKAMGEDERKLEVYDHVRFFTVTGEHLDGTPETIEERQSELDAFSTEVWPDKPSGNHTNHASITPSLTAYEIIDLARGAKNAPKWDRLMRGDLAEYNGDDSRADAALCALAGFYTDDPGVIDQIMRMSRLCRDKWTKRQDYRDRTIAAALELTTERYTASDAGEIRGNGNRHPSQDEDDSETDTHPFRWTLEDLPDGEAPAPLIAPFLADKGLTIIYGPGDVGKGMTATHWIRRLVAECGLRVCIIDYENHPREWRRRAVAMGFDLDDRQTVEYLAPYGDHWPFKTTGPLVSVATPLRKYLDAGKIDYVFIDSYARATAAAEAMGGQKDAADFALGFTMLNRPGLLLAHTADGIKWPTKPFGSVHLHNFARETWAIERPDGEPLTDGSFSVELRARRTAERAQPLGAEFLKFTFDNGTIGVSTQTPPARTALELALLILRRTTDAITTEKIAKAIKADENRTISIETLTRALSRGATDGKVIRVTGVPLKWALQP